MIAIDGPGAVGKSTVGRLLARRLGYRFVDTGAMYRALTWLALKQGINLDDGDALTELARHARIELSDGGEGGSSVVADGARLRDEIWRAPAVEAGVSLVARVPGVREALVASQRQLARQGEVVVVGRDIGTVVLPDAELKIFLVASAEERARRRYLELLRDGVKVDCSEVLADLRERDRIDSERPVSPLKPSPEARIVDTGRLSIQQVVDELLSLVER